MMTNDDVTMMLRTFNEAFPHAMLWKVPDGLDLILLGSRQPIATDVATFRTRVELLNTSGRRLHYVLSRSAEEIVAEIGQSPGIRNTDDLPLLEFRVARAMLAGGPAVLELDDSRDSPRPGRARHFE